MTRLHGRCLLALALAAAGVAVAQTRAPSPGEAALGDAARKQRYLFVLFHKEDDAATRSMKKALDAALSKEGTRAGSITVRATDPGEKALVERWGLARTPMPIVLAVAPNGAVTGGFPLKLTGKDVAGAFVSPGTAECLKATQSRKLVLVCVRPSADGGLPAGVKAFKADPGYGPATEVVSLDASDPAEAAFLQALQIKPGKAAVTALLAPPGSVLGTFAGEVTKEQLVEKLKASQNSCCPGGKCGPGGCCPGGKCEPKK
jgi:hypothetical protein